MTHTIIIEIVKGGFVITYPVKKDSSDLDETITREVFASTRKMNQRIKEILADFSFVE